ncbi:hypothetical protein CspeluHIS016_0207950 [Cutaneotrichosporon spelunceum]|uniref:Uncharacterized protein n=1 Tax=Cutaneotrichosporon spelunceum TaxID=1672016 RepID=A0AAD3TS12_9TREE|nr:hypothetical protein CspeluHIS016_0207950 [Cutaneotrichosporon spelunceum]
MKPPASQLPRLLASLPKEGMHALVRPVQWPENSFWRINRSKLKFNTQEGKEELRAHGTAWGQLFWRGKYLPHARKRQEKVPGSLKWKWVHIPVRSLDAKTRASVEATALPEPLVKPQRVQIKARHIAAMEAEAEAEADGAKSTQ